MGFKGSVESFSLGDVFQNLANNQQTGTLHVFIAGGPEKFVFFQNGQLRNLSHGLGKPLLSPDVFFARGFIDAAQLEQVRQRCQSTNEQPGAALLALNLIESKDFSAVLKLQIEEEVYDLFGWEKAAFEFNEGPAAETLFPPQPVEKPISMPISHLIMEAARRVDEWERLRKQIVSFKEIYCIEPAVLKAMEKGEMEADAVEKRVSSLIDGSRDIEDVILDSSLFKFEVLNAIAGFLQSSLIRPATVHELVQAEQDCARKELPRRRIKVLERILALGGENAQVRRELANALARDEQIDKACIHFTVLAEAELALKKEEAAMELYRRILVLAPKNVKAHEQLAIIYAKRALKREAFVHYRELYEIFRDQNHLPQARAAAAAAVECDPTHTDLRSSLIELLLADGQKDAAAQQLEAMGDQAVKMGNAKLAVDGYRRAMQYRPNNKGLKKKLADVMLTKEDRTARKRRAALALVFFIFCGLGVAGLALKEHLNSRAYGEAETKAAALVQSAARSESEGKFKEAKGLYEQAIECYRPAAELFSPVFNFQSKASAEIARLQTRVSEADSNRLKVHEELSHKADVALENGKSAMKARRISDAIVAFDVVIGNEAASEIALAEAKQGKDQAQQILTRLEQGKARLTRNPNQEFKNVDDEWQFWDKFCAEFRNFPEFKLSDIQWPLLVATNTDDVKVLLDGRLIGTVSIAASKESNTFRFTTAEPKKFEFKKNGFKSVILSTSDIRGPQFTLEMQREPALRVDVRPLLPADVSLAGQTTADDKSFYVGTSEGGLLRVGFDGQLLCEFKFPADLAALNKEVVGPITLVPRENKPPLVIYAVKAGHAFGLEPGERSFKLVWSAKNPNQGKDLSGTPSIVKTAIIGRSPMLALPQERKLSLLDCETGVQVSGAPFDFKDVLTSPAVALDQEAMIIAGCQDGKVRGFALRNQTIREWSPGIDAAAVRATPVFCDGDLLVAADDGRFYIFRGNRPTATSVPLDGSGPIIADPLALKKRAYFGSTVRHGFWCVDLLSMQRLWRLQQAIADVRFAAVAIDNQVYFIDDSGVLYALDAERGALRWSYQTEGKKAPVGPPWVNGKRLFIATKAGIILGFDE
ncbi:MAG TPA: DUF4388 domain-containing protein [Planctomycetota bacterium]|jgi:hypothetical protein